MDDIDTKWEDHVCDETRYRVRAMTKRAKSGKVVGMW